MTIFLALLALVGCGEPADCRRADIDAYLAAVDPLVEQYQRQAELTAATPRVGMGAPLQRLLDIETEARAIEPPGCLEPYHARIVEGMEFQRDGYQQFAAQQSEVVAAARIEAGQLRLNGALADLTPIRNGGPVPTPRP